jgi:hypothetical protein
LRQFKTTSQNHKITNVVIITRFFIFGRFKAIVSAIAYSPPIARILTKIFNQCFKEQNFAGRFSAILPASFTLFLLARYIKWVSNCDLLKSSDTNKKNKHNN